ncbi:ABC transporter substrate-binding protein [Amycolatopsis pithecellobii]|uniref:PhnD/SsuA/transferrin family substrate-binding protein n=1 Tax=Amycolatopsis pithecellobii TaxID=664692 RepID=A0A6N7YMM4_9PSEU|nr:ABC transporter substrate-binding protein [Amycolatopsis pithecellobii]MTD53118.1 hypothetical protein [Amycolatopsis pithecellobii]
MHPTTTSTFLRRSLVAACATTAAVALAACSSGGAAAPASGLTPVSVGFIAATAGFAPELTIQNDPGMCAPYGVAPTMQIVSPQTSGPALAAGKIQVMRHSSGAMLTSAYQNRSAMKIVASVSSPPYNVWGTKDIKSVADLRGKTVGVTAAGSTGDLAMRQLLAEQGMEAGKDVKITYGGDATAVLGLAASNAIQGFLFPPPLPEVASRAGVHELANVAEYRTVTPTLATVIAAAEPFASQHQPAVKGLLQCLQAAIKLTLAKDPKVVQALAKAEGKSVDTAKKEIDAIAAPTAFQLGPFTTDDAKDVMHALESANVQKFDGFDPADAIDTSLAPAN